MYLRKKILLVYKETHSNHPVAAGFVFES